MLKLALVAGALLLAPMSAVAEECAGQTFDEAAKVIEETEGEITAIVEVDGVGFDTLIIIDFHGAVMVGRFNGDCAFGGPIMVGKAVEERGA